MKILVCVPELEKGGGIANYYRALKNHFSMEVEYFTRGSRKAGQGPLGQVGRIMKDYMRFAKHIVGDDRIRVVHINTSFGQKGLCRDAIFVIIAKVKRKKVLVFFRGWDERFERQLGNPLNRLALRSFFLADRILVLSEQFREKLGHWGYGREIKTESTVVDQELIEAALTQPTDSTPGLARVGFTILFLARLERAKGTYTAVDVHAALIKRYPSLRLVIAGDGEDREGLKRYVVERGIPNVEFVGYVRGEEKIRALQCADLYLFPTTHGEGMPNTVLEAMAFGLPIVTRNAGGIGDFFRDGEMGFLTDSTEVGAFVELVVRLIEDADLRGRMAQTNRRYAAEHFAARKVVERLQGVYGEILTQGT